MPNPPKLRLQISLRMLMLLVASVGVGLMIFRWPWEERDKAAEPHHPRLVQRTTTYRRAWDGSPVKHGAERWFDDQRRCLLEINYSDGMKLLTLDFDLAGKLTSETRYYHDRGEAITTSIDDHAGEPIHYKSRGSLRTSDWSKEWRTQAGERLEFLKFTRTHVTEWNGRSFDEAALTLLAEVSDPLDRAGWMAAPSAWDHWQLEELGDNTYRRFFLNPISPLTSPQPLTNSHHHEIVVHFAKSDPSFDRDWTRNNMLTLTAFSQDPADAHISFLNWFLYDAQCRKPAFTLRCRFGVLCVVPITQRELQPGDSTGVTLVTFEPGSPQETDWLTPILGVPTDVLDHRQRLAAMFQGTSLIIDSSCIAGQNQVYDQLAEYPPMTYRRPRRDVFGIFLSYNNYRVEQQGTTLIVLPRTP